MSNGYTATPGVIPGGLTIAGNLQVNGQVQVGAAPRIVRLGVFAGLYGGVSHNFQFDNVSRDNTSDWGGALLLRDPVTGIVSDRVVANGGTTKDTARQLMLANDGTPHVNTGNTTENTMFTRTIPGNFLGANGGFALEIVHAMSVNTSGGTTLRVYFGGTLIFSVALNGVLTDVIRAYATQQASSTNCQFYGMRVRSDNTVATLGGGTAVDGGGDRILLVTLQNVTSTNISQLNLVRITDYIGDVAI